MSKPTVSLLITDLDNTLYDWVTYFASAFSAMVSKAVEILHIPYAQLLDELQTIHKLHHNSEHPFALLEIASVKVQFGHLTRRERQVLLDDAFHAFNKTRKATLKLYEGVQETLGLVCMNGCPIVAHTEATVPNAMFRIKSLGLYQYLNRLYALEPTGQGHPDPEREEFLMPDPNFVSLVPRSQRKPSPELILNICSYYGVPPSQAVYVGDSLTRDISMAKQAGVWSVWARYGTEYSREDWAKLVRVTHWSGEDVNRETELSSRYSSIRPDVELSRFEQLVGNFSFTKPSSSALLTSVR